ncbi:MAG: sulfatase [Elusimicrobiota bacterium]|nr:sulfatase [Elusimicrobiota bacterium]
MSINNAPLGAALALALGAAPALAAAPRPKSVVLVVVDALGARHLGAYGHERPTSPRLDALAARGLLFESVTAASNWTLPSLASLMTGLDPAVHGALAAPDDPGWVTRLEAGRLRPGPGGKLDPRLPTLASLLARRGYRTAAVVSGAFCRSAFGFGTGFAVYHDLGGRAEDLEPVYLPLLEKERGRPFFLYLHLNDAHEPYRAPAPHGTRWVDPAYRGPMDGSRRALSALQAALAAGRADPADLRRAHDLYDGGVSYADAHIGRLLDRLDELGLAEEVAVVVTADHGEGFGEHGALRHGDHFHEEALRVPLIMRLPGLPQGLRLGGAARHVDVAPTVLEYLGVAAPPMQGRSLLPWARGVPPEERDALSESADGVALRRGPLKLIRWQDRPPRLYDLAADPDERRDLAAERPDAVAALEAALAARPRRKGPPPATLRDKLKASGYLD